MVRGASGLGGGLIAHAPPHARGQPPPFLESRKIVERSSRLRSQLSWPMPRAARRLFRDVPSRRRELLMRELWHRALPKLLGPWGELGPLMWIPFQRWESRAGGGTYSPRAVRVPGPRDGPITRSRDALFGTDIYVCTFGPTCSRPWRATQ